MFPWEIVCNIFFLFDLFQNKHANFHYDKLKLQQNDINTKNYKILKFKQRLQSMENKIQKKEDRKKFHPIFSKKFSHIVYLSLHQNLLKTIHLRY